MNAMEATNALNNEAKRWNLHVGRNGEDVTFWVSGAALPPGRRRGERMFYGHSSQDARVALIEGALEMERVKELG